MGKPLTLRDFRRHELYRLGEFINMAKLIGKLLYDLGETVADLTQLYDEDDQIAESEIKPHMEEIADSCRALGMGNEIFNVLDGALESARRGSLIRNDFLVIMGTLSRVIYGKLDGMDFMHLNGEEAKLFKQPLLKWESVFVKLPETTEDAENASKCLATGSYTASVFHLMRIMECGVKLATTKMNIGLEEIDLVGKSWGGILRPMSNAIEKLEIERKNHATSAERKNELKSIISDYSETASHLKHVKDAWRNDTMHPKKTYTEEEAREIYRFVRTFMRNLCK